MVGWFVTPGWPATVGSELVESQSALLDWLEKKVFEYLPLKILSEEKQV